MASSRVEIVDLLMEMRDEISDRLRRFYPMVNEEETSLPRSWSPKNKFTYIVLSNGNLTVHYEGPGISHGDAASVRATHPIPTACGLYYFEVKIVNKGRDGYIGIGLSAQNFNIKLLPGWDEHSYGYHGDDGHSFCSSGTGLPYGPTFTTGDTIGCGYNLIDNTCFYTINGHNLGIAFTDLPSNLYPTVGLQTPGGIVEANFGQTSFLFDIEDVMKELRTKTKHRIENFPIPDSYGELQTIHNRLVSSYLMHHGYSATTEAFAASTGQDLSEGIASTKNRQKILKLVLAGRMGEAIDLTMRLYPGLLKNRPNLMLMLKCQQFIEMMNGGDIEYSNRHTVQTSITEPYCGLQNEYIAGEKKMTDLGCGMEKHCEESRPPTEIILDFGRELRTYSQQIFSEYGTHEMNKKMLQDAFSLLAYSNPRSSPVGWLLDPLQRETVCAELNSAILDSSNMARRPALEVAIAHAKELNQLMCRSGLGSCAFANVDQIINN